MNTFGYNGLLQLDGLLLDKLFSGQTTSSASGVGNDFFTVKSGNDGQTKTCVFLRLEPTGLDFTPATANDTSIGLYLPFQFAIFTKAPEVGAQWVRTAIPANIFGTIETIVVGISPLALKAAEGQIIPAFTTLMVDNIQLYVVPPAVNLEYPMVNSLLPLRDQDVQGTGVDLGQLKDQILATIKSMDLSRTGLPVPTSALVSALNTDEVGGWDFKLLSAADPEVGADGIDLLLSKSADGGQGLRNEAGNTLLPPDAGKSNYHLAINLSGSVMLDVLEKTVISQGYYKQQDDRLNTRDYPLGYMVVPTVEPEETYWLPGLQGGIPTEVKLSKPIANDKAHLAVPKEGLAAYSRAVVHNIDTNTETPFTAHSDGSATVDVNARGGNRLTIEIKAISRPDQPDSVIWKPTCELRDGAIRITVHFYQYSSNCDVEGDGQCEIGLKPDLNSKTDITPYIRSSSLDLPWWVDFLVYVVPFGFLLKISVEDLFKKTIIETFNSAFPKVPDMSMELFMEQIDLKTDGIEFCCYADAGRIADADRRLHSLPLASDQIQNLGVPGLPANVRRSGDDLVLDLPLSFASPGVFGSSANVQFWAARFHDRPAQAQYTERSLTIKDGHTMFFWVPGGFGAATKVLAIWSGSPSYTLELIAIEYMSEPDTPAKIIDHIEAIPIEAPLAGLAGLYRYFKYTGTITLEAVKFYRALESRQAGLEHWFWDGTEVPLGGSLTIPGGTVQWDLDVDQLFVALDQTGIIGNGNVSVNTTHSIEFSGEDVFGRPMHAKHFLFLPMCVFNGPEIDPLYPVSGILHLPIPEELQGIIDLVREGKLIEAAAGLPQASRLVKLVGNHPAAYSALQKLAEAIETGKANVDSRQAQVLFAALLKTG